MILFGVCVQKVPEETTFQLMFLGTWFVMLGGAGFLLIAEFFGPDELEDFPRDDNPTPRPRKRRLAASQSVS
jgi:hypothetical protein